jgi:hypothetical protein
LTHAANPLTGLTTASWHFADAVVGAVVSAMVDAGDGVLVVSA